MVSLGRQAKPSSLPFSNISHLVVFLLLVLINSVLAHIRLVPVEKLFLGVVFLSGVFFLISHLPLGSGTASKVVEMKMFVGIPTLLLAILVIGGIAARLWGLTSLSGWPLSDEGYNSYYSLRLMEKWDWSLWIGEKQYPPFFYWCEALFFRWMGPSLFSLWFFPAFWSIATLGLVYWVARRFFNSGFAVLCLILSLFNYWFLWCGRLSEISLALPWGLVTLGCLGMFLDKSGKKVTLWPAIMFGVVSALNGYMAMVSAAMAALMVLVVVLRGWRYEGPDKWRMWGGFASGFLLTLSPLILTTILHGFSQHPASLLFLHPSRLYDSPWIGPLSNVTGIFWGARDSTLWGGFLNPLETSLVFWGGAFILKARRPSFIVWILPALFFFFLPGLLTNCIEHFRVILAAPFLLALSALGLGWLLEEGVDPRSRGKAAWVLLFLIGSLNLYHLFGPYHAAWGTPGPECSRFKSIEAWRAYGELDEARKRLGPGLVFIDFAPPTLDQTLSLATYPFNALQNAKIPIKSCEWVAVLTNAQWQKSLARRFPKAEWHFLSEHLTMAYGGAVLGIVPLESVGWPALEHWREASNACCETDRFAFYFRSPRSHALAVEFLGKKYIAFQGDPFLESVYWNKVERLRLLLGDKGGEVEALQKGLQRGYPSPFFSGRLRTLPQALPPSSSITPNHFEMN